MENANDLTERVKLIAQEYGLTSSSFADRVEIPRPVLSHIFSGRNKPSLEVVQKIGKAFPEVDLAWLLYGKGEMLKIIASPDQIEKAVNPRAHNEDKVAAPTNFQHEETVPEKLVGKNSKVNHVEPTLKRVLKIVYFYEDYSFEEFRPHIKELE